MGKVDTRSKESEAARQAAARARRQAHGNCIRCGLRRDPNSKQLCSKHLDEQRQKARVRYGVQAWRPGSRGRPPMTETCRHVWDDTLPRVYRCIRCRKEVPKE